MVEAKTKSMLSERVARLREMIISGKPKLSCERLYHLREALKENEREPAVIRAARIFERFLLNMSISIDENPIVGKQTEYLLGVVPYPEYSVSWMKDMAAFGTHLGATEVSEEDRELLNRAADYWGDKCIWQKTVDEWSRKYSNIVPSCEDYYDAGVWYTALDSGKGRVCVDYGKVLNKGLEGVIEEARDVLKDLPLGSLEALRKRNFLDAVIITCNAVIALARRYASLAKEMSQVEIDPGRKKELERISETCKWVPAKPARSFYEAVQSFWFVHLAMFLELGSYGHAPGRFSQYMYPFYERDKERGELNEEEALELLELLFLKFCTIGRFAIQRSFQATMGNLFQNMAIGVVTPKGEDATNKLDYLLVEAQKRVRLVQPTLSLIYHDKLPEELLIKAIELVKTGIGMPAFFNSDLNIQRLCAHGVSLEDARNHCLIGCVECGLSHTSDCEHGGTINFPKILELALHNGKDPVSGKQLGLATREAEVFQSYEELWDALRKQTEYIMKLNRDFEHLGHAFHAEYTPAPLHSALIDDCLKNAKDMGDGGTRYRMDGATVVGTVDMADSLAAIKKLVFDEKRVTMNELLRALEANFEGHEELQRMCLEAPKYGNDIDYVDLIARDLYDLFYEEHQKHNDHLGRTTIPAAYSTTNQYPFGACTGALPSGRKAGVPLADGSVSPSPGKDVNGPTGLIRSASKAIDTTKYACSLLNMKFHPTTLQGNERQKKLLALIKTYFDWNGHHVQFNVVSADTLKDAQLHPENYKDLLVRVAGFSALFVHLAPVVQEEIIKRTELQFE